METIGKRFYRPLATLLMFMLVLALAAPNGGVSAQAGVPMSDDFNMCSLNGVWTFENPAGVSGADPVFNTPYTGDAHLSMTVPADQVITFSNTNKDAPRIMQPISDESFEVETRFIAPMTADGNHWKIMGMLVRDSSVDGQDKWLRVDFNSRNGNLNGYIGYLSGSTLQGLYGPTDLPGANPTAGPITIRLKYDKAASSWTFTWIIGESGTLAPREIIVAESTFNAGFTPTDIGIFVGSTTGTGVGALPPPGNTAVVDYFHNLADGPVSDDATVLTVNMAGTGQGTVNRSCTGDQMTLTAAPASNSSFGGWSGDATGTGLSTMVTMDASKTVTATFNLGGGVVLDIKTYLPTIKR